MSEKIEFKPVLTKIASEIRFRPTLDSWKSVFDAARVLEDSYKEWRIKESKPDDILLYSPDEKASIRVCYNRIVYANEASTDVTKMNAQVKSAFELLGVRSNIKEILHIGFRKILIYETKLNFEELADVVHSRFYNKAQTEGLPFSINDVQVVLDGKSADGKLLNHLRVGPTESEQSWAIYDSSFEQSNPLNSGKSYLYLDVDSYSSKNVSIDSALDIKDLCIENNKLVVNAVMAKLEV